MKTNNKKGKNKNKGKRSTLNDLSDITRCKECGKILPNDRISCYCEDCERHILYEQDILL